MTGLWTSFFSPEASNKNVKPHGPLHSKVLLFRVPQKLPSPGYAAISQSWPWGMCQDNLFLTKAWWHPLNLRAWKAAGHEHRAAPSPTCQHPQKGVARVKHSSTKLSPAPLREGCLCQPLLRSICWWLCGSHCAGELVEPIVLYGRKKCTWGMRLCCWLRFKNELSNIDLRAKLGDYLKTRHLNVC